jgi:hypothetical protein
MSARPLFDPGPALGGLTDRQQEALDHLQHHPEGVRSSDLGRYLHMRRGCPYCSPERLCKYAMSTGEEVGRQLRKRDLAIKRRESQKWQALVGVVDGRIDPSTSDWPQGF